MRVIGGEFRSRVLKSMSGLDVRPTPDRMRETLFNVLSEKIPGSIFMDAYAGTGAVGIEALSRGASKAIFLERSRTAAGLIRENLRSLGIENRAVLLLGKATVNVPKFQPDILFLDPPYPLESEYLKLMTAIDSAPPPLVIAQHSTHFKLKETYGTLRCYRTIRQSDNVLSFFAPDVVLP